MRKFPVQDDLKVFSKTDTPDEERLLQLYRNCSSTERNEILYRVTRLNFGLAFAAREQTSGYKLRLADESHHLYEELEQGLRDICPTELLKELRSVITEQQFSGLWQGAWGGIATVILGTTEQDGQRADELYKEIMNVASALGMYSEFNFSRHDALELIETWREATLVKAFSRGDMDEPT